MSAALCVTVLTVNMFLNVFCPPGVLADRCEGVRSSHFISAPKKMEALSGTCLLIPCSFTPKEWYISSKVSAGWIKRGDDVYDISNSVKTFSAKIKGNLTETNCTSVFSGFNTNHSGEYFFRVEMRWFKATAVCDPLHVTVKDSAWSPSIKVSGDLKDLKEEESVSITCSAQTPCPHSPPELTWSLQQDSQRTEKNPDGTFTTKIQKNMILSDTHDGDNITCSVRYPVDGGKRKKTAETNLTLSVSYAPKDTSASISPSGVVSAGSWVELSCSSRAKPPARTFTWFRNSSEGFTKVSVGQVYRFNASEGGEFYCEALNDLGNQTSPVVLLNLKDSAWSPSIKVSGDLKEEESVSITCSAQTPCPDSPPELTWSLQQDSQRTEKNPDGTFTTKIQENMILSDTHDGDNITCSVRYPVDGGQRNKTAETNLTLSVSYAPKNTSASISPSGVVSAGSWVELSCSSRAKPPARTFTWFRNSSEGFTKVSVGQVYSFSASVDGQFYCEALNDLGNQTSPVVLLTVEGSSNELRVLVAIPVGIILLICLVVSVWCFKSKRRTPPETQVCDIINMTSKSFVPPQSQRAEEVAKQKPASGAEEELHYGDVSFFKNRPEASSASEQDGGQQETVYAQVKLSTPGNCSTQTAGGPEELYAQIKM
ncbi:vascular cell adhesion protein 1-like [Nematolebias whitei]|uniref:vascular cell adhesion protein 1-like n=1 Tax=Nematolebias whitei TaxID=451745 RepID=UPI00189997DC|nr:vascular cell adhesion protein 1-like [Nematolebias whitei]